MAVEKITKSKYKLPKKAQNACHSIIHTASLSAAGVGAGLAQIPLADNAVITPIQITMIISLGKVFNQEVTKSIAQGLLGGFVANFVGRGVAQAAWGWIPGIGNASNAITAAAITESVGWICVDHFYKEKYLSQVDTASIDDVSNEQESQPSIDIEKKNTLIEAAMKFINGEKTRIGNMDEYAKILNEFETILNEDENDEEFNSIHAQLLKVK